MLRESALRQQLFNRLVFYDVVGLFTIREKFPTGEFCAIVFFGKN